MLSPSGVRTRLVGRMRKYAPIAADKWIASQAPRTPYETLSLVRHCYLGKKGKGSPPEAFDLWKFDPKAIVAPTIEPHARPIHWLLMK